VRYSFSPFYHLAVLALGAGCSGYETFPTLEGPYFGQEPPGMTPEVFAPGIISIEGQYEGGATFSGDGQWFAYKREYLPNPDIEKIWISEIRDGRWVEPYLAPFNSDSSSWDFGFARAGKLFYFTSRRHAVMDGLEADPSNIWRTQPTEEGWAEPILVESPVNVVDTYSGYPSLTTDGTIYFHSNRDDSQGAVDIYRARLTDGQYVVENLGLPVNSTARELDPCIAPNESYLVFVSDRPGGVYDQGLFISFRTPADTWTEPQAIGDVLGNNGGLPSISPDGRYFFYAAGDYSDISTIQIYWVDTRVFDQFRVPERR
jgi:hypothetical protein